MSVVDAFDAVAAGTKEVVDAVVITFTGSQALTGMGDRVAHAIAGAFARLAAPPDCAGQAWGKWCDRHACKRTLVA